MFFNFYQVRNIFMIVFKTVFPHGRLLGMNILSFCSKDNRRSQWLCTAIFLSNS
uniref:Uncharacterized protein n=1 Tax=Rhizophora mucronata TaxID=61149 RepID=A0A2P2NSJ0_RHIMU